MNEKTSKLTSQPASPCIIRRAACSPECKSAQRFNCAASKHGCKNILLLLAPGRVCACAFLKNAFHSVAESTLGYCPFLVLILFLLLRINSEFTYVGAPSSASPLPQMAKKNRSQITTDPLPKYFARYFLHHIYHSGRLSYTSCIISCRATIALRRKDCLGVRWLESSLRGSP